MYHLMQTASQYRVLSRILNVRVFSKVLGIVVSSVAGFSLIFSVIELPIVFQWWGSLPSNRVTLDAFSYVFLHNFRAWFFQCIANRYRQTIWWNKFLIWRLRVSVIDYEKCSKSPHTISWGDFGHRKFTQLILRAQSGLFIYITLTLKRIIVGWSNLSAIILNPILILRKRNPQIEVTFG